MNASRLHGTALLNRREASRKGSSMVYNCTGPLLRMEAAMHSVPAASQPLPVCSMAARLPVMNTTE